jgi:ABC-2 type transport system permease protein
VKRADGKYEITIRIESRKFKADSHGKETEVPVDDWIDIGAFATPSDGAKYGSALYRKRVHITKRDCVFDFVTAQLPDQAGVDPFALMIDRDPNDNLKSVTLR